MIKKQMIALLILVSITAAKAQQQDHKMIEQLCGCYDITFTYAETFAQDTNYKFHDRYTAHATELVVPIEQSDNKFVLQHMLVINDDHVIKHWREDWTYEGNELLSFKGDNKWQKESLKTDDTKGKWVQSVWQVNDIPRYQGHGTWISNNGKTYWESTTDAPLPRREYKVRDDYNVMRRTNKIAITSNGWVHEQDNDKIIRTKDGDSVLVQEKGMNTYVKVDDSKCATALKQWEERKEFWAVIRSAWEGCIAKHDVLVIKDEVDGKKLYKYLSPLEEEWNEKKLSKTELTKKAANILELFVSDKVASVN